MLTLNNAQMNVIAREEAEAKASYEARPITEKQETFLLQKGFSNEFVKSLSIGQYNARMSVIKVASDNLNSFIKAKGIDSFAEYEEKKELLLSKEDLEIAEGLKQDYLQTFWPKETTFRNVIMGAVAVPVIEGRSEEYSLQAYRFGMTMVDFNKVKKQIAEDNRTLRSYFNDVSARQAYLEGMVDADIDHSRDREEEDHRKFLASLSEEQVVLLHLTRKLSTIVGSCLEGLENPLKGDRNNPVILSLREIRDYMISLEGVTYKSSFTGKEVKMSSPITRLLIFKDFVDNEVIDKSVLLYITHTSSSNYNWMCKLLNGEIAPKEEVAAQATNKAEEPQPLPKKKVDWANYKK